MTGSLFIFVISSQPKPYLVFIEIILSLKDILCPKNVTTYLGIEQIN